MGEYLNLRKFLGDAWVDAEVFGPAAKHFLGTWRMRYPNNQFLPFVEAVIQRLFAAGNVAFESERLTSKFKAEFWPTLAEIEWAVFLSEQGYEVTLEPTAPERGPDLRANKQGTSYYFEIRTVGPSEPEREFETASRDVFKRLKDFPTGYHITFDFRPGFSVNPKDLKRTVTCVKRTLEKLTRPSRASDATLYCFSPDDTALNIGGDIEWSPGVTFSAEDYRRYERSEKAPLAVRFRDRRDGRAETTVAAISAPRFDNSDPRIRNILGTKRGQLPAGERGIIILDGSNLSILEASLRSALYGKFKSDASIFTKSSRVVAVVFYSRYLTPPDSPIQINRIVYPTNRTDAGSVRLSLKELESFGQIPQDLRRLASEEPAIV